MYKVAMFTTLRQMTLPPWQMGQVGLYARPDPSKDAKYGWQCKSKHHDQGSAPCGTRPGQGFSRG